MALDKLRIFGTSQRPNKARILLRMARFSPRVVSDVLYDVSRYAKYSCSYHTRSVNNLKSRITAKYHEIEKGLSLSAPRKGFGAERVDGLIVLMREYMDRYGVDGFLRVPCDVLRAYAKFNLENAFPDYPYKARIQQLLDEIGVFEGANVGGVTEIRSETIRNVTSGVTDEFFLSRYSIRQLSSEAVNTADIDAAVAIALKSPAVCNRQNGYVHVVEDKDLIRQMLEIQGGAKGFAEQIDKLLVITNKLTGFWDSGERNQCWIDGGMFSMSLILGLHAKGLGTCCLNWSKTAVVDRVMRKLLGLPDSEVIIMLLAVGHIPDSLNVAYSSRKSVSESRRNITNWLNKPVNP
jgi:nitroreductase